ncbi:sodium/calcium exchanger NCL-like [Quercus lobata]|uniref:EF-hand domain-containing protein n=1 Tax=Quercus lobata TaxID=97700 RepID=A0A7N2MAJ3_QUELO|nr:sodium/calcium exchanger NCL-like [Quercus lobata]
MSNHLLSVSTFGLFLLLLGGSAYGLFITHRPFSPDLISDGIHDSDSSWGSYPVLNRLSAESSTSTCDQTYGFLPCTTSVMGNLFLMVVYGYLMYFAAMSLTEGSEHLMKILGPGIVGSLVLPILGALPDAMLVIVSGIFGTTETAQSQISIGMGMVAGSTVLLLTIIWGSCVIAGKCDLVDSIALDAQDTKGFNLTESGISTDIWTSYAARLMLISVIPLLIVQIPQILNSILWRHIAVMIGLIASLLLFVSYSTYQVLQPKIQKRKIDYVKHKHVFLGFLKHLKKRALGRLLDENGEPDRVTIENLFSSIDANHDGHISDSELRALMVGINFEEIDLDQSAAVDKIMNDFDTSGNSVIDKDEFVNGISRWLNKAKLAAARNAVPFSITTFINDYHKKTKREHDLLDVGGSNEVEGVKKSKQASIKAVLSLLLGTIIAAAFADPLVDTIDNFADATSIPAFFISFIVLPLATSSRDTVSAIRLASQDKRHTASLSFSEIYATVTIHNVLSIPVFLALVYIRGLTWDFSSEVLVILIVSIVMGSLGSFRTHFPLWTSILAILLYPFSLALIYVLHYYYGWS